MRAVLGIAIVLLVIGAVFGIYWSGSLGFGMRQAVEFFPYDEETTLDSGATIRSSGVMVLVNRWEAAQTDQDMANLMLSAEKMYPSECSGNNWEVAIRRPNPSGGEEKYSFYFSIYETGGAGSWIEYGKWVNDQYAVIKSYRADWLEIAQIATGQAFFQIVTE
jgi:hypothetical protein